MVQIVVEFYPSAEISETVRMHRRQLVLAIDQAIEELKLIEKKDYTVSFIFK